MNLPAKKIDFENENELRLAPLLKWAGGKRWLVPKLNNYFSVNCNKRLVEPFVGGMSVALGLMPQRALLNDANSQLINFYKQVKKGLISDIRMRNDEDSYYKKRDRLNKLIELNKANTKEAALIFYYLNRTCFNGLCRFNSKGQFNVPFGRYSQIAYITDFTDYKSILGNWSFENTDFANLEISKSDFIYVDPPYDVQFTKYSKDDFKWEDQERLVAWLLKFKCPIIASNQATDRIVKLYKKSGFNVKIVSAPRRISCNGDRTDALEILATKNI